MDTKIALILFIIADVFIMIAVFFRFSKHRANTKSSNENLEKLKVLWKEKKINHPLASAGWVASQVIDGTTFKTSVIGGSGSRRSGPPKVFLIRFESPVRQGVDINIKTESGFDSWSKNANLVREHQTGDKQFDDRFYITCEDRQAVMQLFGTSESRALLSNLYDLGVSEIAIGAGKLVATVTPYNIPVDLDSDKFLRVSPYFPELIKRINSLTVVEDLSSKILGCSKPKFFRGLAWSVFGVAGLTMMFGLVLYRAFDWYGLFTYSLSYSVPIWVANLLFVYFMAAGSSHIHRSLAWTLFIGGLGWIGLGFTSCALINGAYDESAPVEVVTTVIDKYLTRSKKNGTKYYLSYNLPFDPGGSHDVSVHLKEYNSAQLNQSQIKLMVHEGFLGFKWMRSYDILI